MKSFTAALEIKNIEIREDKARPFVHVKFVDPKNGKPFSEHRCFFGDKNIEIGRTLKVGDKFHVETNEFDKKDDNGNWRSVVIRTIIPVSDQ